MQIAAQMYTLRDTCADAAGIAASCKKLKDMGFNAIQASAAYFSEIEAKELKTILDDTGMVCCSTHMGLDRLKDAQAAADYHNTIGAKYTAIGGYGWGGEGPEQWKAFIADYIEIAKALGEAGVRVGYHNHSHEFAPFGILDNPAGIDPSQSPWALLTEHLKEPAYFEVDTYWVAHGGAEPSQVLSTLSGRVPAIHCKDYTVTPSREVKMCEVGSGNLNWPAILKEAKDGGCEWLIIERDSGDLDPFESLKISFEKLSAML